MTKIEFEHYGREAVFFPSKNRPDGPMWISREEKEWSVYADKLYICRFDGPAHIGFNEEVRYGFNQPDINDTFVNWCEDHGIDPRDMTDEEILLVIMVFKK